MVAYHLISAKDQLHHFGKKFLLGVFLGYALCAGGNWKGDILIADLEDLEQLDASEVYPRGVSAGGLLIAQEENELKFRKLTVQPNCQ